MGCGKWHDEGKGRGGFEKGPHNPLSLIGAAFSMCSCCGLLLADKSNPNSTPIFITKLTCLCESVGKSSLVNVLSSSDTILLFSPRTLPSLPYKKLYCLGKTVIDHVKLSCKHPCSCSIPSIQPAYAIILSPHHKAPTRATSKSEEFQRIDSKIFHKPSRPFSSQLALLCGILQKAIKIPRNQAQKLSLIIARLVHG
ncbi:hypothetical protein NC653_013247 [Populus alba x Populus x berolinensis]|uniref:Uncharacterized protein n=1 Tax=Populus alba x Populus x berolinensis TaxID=444605 RepID=A0AAD6QU59_9ROSI|nr:hypothetical protein NC653_013247 [Populus alba x Populus x berolinensis]